MPLNLMHDAGFVLCGGSSAVSGRWGDYAATAVDGSAKAQDFMWFASENALANSRWGTCIGANGFTAENQP